MENASKIAIIGLGSQAKAWALNLRDSGVEVTIGLREGSSSFAVAEKLNLKALAIGEWLKNFSTIIVLTPDHEQKNIIEKNLAFFSNGTHFIFAHGWSYIRNFKDQYPQFNMAMLAPKAIASEVRFQYETKGKLGAAYSLEGCKDKESSLNLILHIAKAIGITAGPYQSTFAEETKADLFSEQTILCSLLPYGALYSYKTLRKNGVAQEMAFMECWLEVKLIANALISLGPIEFFKLISPNALYGSTKASKVLFDKEYQAKLDSLFHDIDTGVFYEECENANQQQMREEVLNLWQNEELQEVFERLKDELIP